MDDKTKELLANIHNTIAQMHPTGDDIIKAASIIMDIRRQLAPEPEEEGETNE